MKIFNFENFQKNLQIFAKICKFLTAGLVVEFDIFAKYGENAIGFGVVFFVTTTPFILTKKGPPVASFKK